MLLTALVPELAEFCITQILMVLVKFTKSYCGERVCRSPSDHHHLNLQASIIYNVVGILCCLKDNVCFAEETGEVLSFELCPGVATTGASVVHELRYG